MPEPIDTQTFQSPGWWLQALATKLHNRRIGRDGRYQFTRKAVESSKVRPGLELLRDYLKGDPPLREDIHSAWAAPFRQYTRMGRLNIGPLVVSATANRMTIRDFRTAAGDDDLGDVEARKLMRVNKLRLVYRQVHDDMLGMGDGYTLVTPPDSRRPYSLITAESPMHCITAHDAATGETIAGLKMFRDDWDATDWAYLYLPGELWVARADVPTSTLFTGRQLWTVDRQWYWDEERFDDIPNNAVPLVRFENKDGVSEIEGVLDTLDRINDKLFNEWWIGKIQAFRQRALQMAAVDEDGASDFEDQVEDELERQDLLQRVPDVASMSDAELSGLFTSAPDAFWTLPAGAKIWESTPVDLRQLVESIKAELSWLASAKSIPLHTITPDAANGSAEGASLQREEHVFKIEDRIDRADAAWARTLALAFGFQGDDERADVTKLEPIWGPVERYSLQEKSTAARQLWGIVPTEAIFTDVLQYSPADVVERLRPLRQTDLLLGLMPPAPPAGSPTDVQADTEALAGTPQGVPSPSRTAGDAAGDTAGASTGF